MNLFFKMYTYAEDSPHVMTHLQSGGAISNSGRLKFLKNTTLATFTGNRSSDTSGGAVQNGGEMKFKGGAVFDDNFTESDGGAIGNSGSLT